MMDNVFDSLAEYDIFDIVPKLKKGTVMTFEEILEMAMDNSVTDDAVFEVLKYYLAEKYDADGNIIPLTFEKLIEMRVLETAVFFQRSVVFEKFKAYVIEGHRNCCGSEANGTE